MIVPTIKVKPWGKDQGDFVEINQADFNDADFELYVEGEPKPEDATAEEIATAIAALDAKNDEHWTKGGLPDVAVLATAIGKKVTRAAVEAAAPESKRPE